MRCPKCGFISFDDLAACAKCNLQLEGKNGLAFEGTAIRAQHAISLRVTAAGPGEPELMPAEETDLAGDLYRELAAESQEAGLTGEAEGEMEIALSLDEAGDEAAMDVAAAGEDDDGEEIPILETEEELPAIDLSGFGAEEDEAGEEAVVAEGGAAAGLDDPEELELDLMVGEENEELDLSAAGETEEMELASPGTAANLEGIDLAGLMGEEQGTAAEESDGGIYDLSDLMTEEGDADDVLALGTDDESGGHQAADEEAMLDLTFDEPGSLDLGLGSDDDGGGEELEFQLELDDTSEESVEAAPKAGLPPSGLSLETDDDG